MEGQHDVGFEESLMSAGLLREEQLERARRRSARDADGIVEAIVSEGFATRQAVMSLMSDYLKIPYQPLAIDTVDPRAAKRIPSTMAFEYRVVPTSISGKTITLATCSPLDIEAQENLSFASGFSLPPVLSDWPEIREALVYFFPEEFPGEGAQPEEPEGLECVARYEDGRFEEEECDETEIDEDYVVRLVDRLMIEAVKKRASDIHIEPKMDHATVRFRIDGVLGKVTDMSMEVHRAVVSRIKILSVLDISERRRPQDGVVFMKYGRRDVDFRVATSPTIYGESVTMRVLDQGKAHIDLATLGFDQEDRTRIEKALGEPYGFILSTGPTGSGKTTTMYAMLNHLDSLTRKIVTIEDPVEYRMDNVTQIPVNVNIDLGFAPLLRSVLRQDPNVILVGEIRDSETAHVAVQAALTGHIMLSTLHTTDAPEVLLRLMEIGVEHYYVREVVKLIVAQRLARKLCADCRAEYQPGPEELAEMGLEPGGALTAYRAVGCALCDGTGYLDRLGVFEVMPMTEEIRDIITPGVQLDDVTEIAMRQGMHTLWQNGVAKVLAGETTLEEIRRTLPR
jgi:type IV pilus assembly protein PilB